MVLTQKEYANHIRVVDEIKDGYGSIFIHKSEIAISVLDAEGCEVEGVIIDKPNTIYHGSIRFRLKLGDVYSISYTTPKKYGKDVVTNKKGIAFDSYASSLRVTTCENDSSFGYYNAERTTSVLGEPTGYSIHKAYDVNGDSIPIERDMIEDRTGNGTYFSSVRVKKGSYCKLVTTIGIIEGYAFDCYA